MTFIAYSDNTTYENQRAKPIALLHTRSADTRYCVFFIQ